jgi:hypothetical protein
LLYHLRLQPSEVENLPFYEYEFIVQNLIDILKEKQEAEEGQHKQYADMTPGSVMKQAGKYMPKGVGNNSFKMPSMSSYSPASFPGIPSSLKI